MKNSIKKRRSIQPIVSIIRWFDTEADVTSLPADDQKKVDWFRILPLVFMHGNPHFAGGVAFPSWKHLGEICARSGNERAPVAHLGILYFVRRFITWHAGPCCRCLKDWSMSA